jgi:hypothetical protein
VAADRPLDTYLALLLADQSSELAAAHDELYPERIVEGIPLSQWEDGGAVYAVPEPEHPLRDLMRELWRRFPQFPPYRQKGIDPPPHASLIYTGGDDPAAAIAKVEGRVGDLLPAVFRITEVVLMEETEPDRFRVRETFGLGT